VADLTLPDARFLTSTANGRGPRAASASDVIPLIEAGFVQLIPPSQAEALLQYLSRVARAQQTRDAAHALLRGGPTSRLLPWLARRRRAQAEDLARRADEIDGEARSQWIYLSSHELIGIDLGLCAEMPDGGYLRITDAGRLAVRRFLCSQGFEREHASAQTLGDRVQRFISLRGELVKAGFALDPRVDLAAAMLSRETGDPSRIMEMNRLATQARWRNYDRLPVVAALALREGSVEAVWGRFLAAYEVLRRAGYDGTYETRLATVALMRAGEVDDAVRVRMWEVARRLRRDGWSLGQSTDPVAARLVGLRLSPTQIAARVRGLAQELARGSWTQGSYLDLAASIAADSNLHPLAAKDDSAQVLEAQSKYREFVDRYDTAIPRSPGDDTRPALPAALLAAMPGTVAGNLRRLESIVEAIGDSRSREASEPLAVMLLDGAYPEWFDCTRFVWEIGSLLPIEEPTSAFTAYGRGSALYGGMAAKAEMSKPGGPSDGVG